MTALAPAAEQRTAAAPAERMRALTLVADRKIELREVAPPPAPGPGEAQIAIKALGLNHIDVWVGAAWRSPNARCRSLSAPRRPVRSLGWAPM
jgi:hypothetical protein